MQIHLQRTIKNFWKKRLRENLPYKKVLCWCSDVSDCNIKVLWNRPTMGLDNLITILTHCGIYIEWGSMVTCIETNYTRSVSITSRAATNDCFDILWLNG